MTISAPANSKSTQHGGLAPSAGASSELNGQGAGPVVPAHELHQTRERIVILMMTLVAAAVGAMFHLHLAYSLFGAAAAGVVLWSSFIALHTLKKRAVQIGRLRQDVSRLEQEVGRLRTQSPGSAAKAGSTTGAVTPPVDSRAAPGASNSISAAGTALASQDAKRAPNLTTDNDRSGGALAGGPTSAVGAPERISPEARWEAPDLGRPSLARPDVARPELNKSVRYAQPANIDTIPQNSALAPVDAKPDRANTAARPATSQRAGERPNSPDLFEAPSWSGTSITSADPLRDAWSFRPKEAAEATQFAPDSGAAVENAHRIPAPPIGVHAPRGIEADLEMVQRKIKAMAEEVNAAEATRLRPLTEPKSALVAIRTAPPPAASIQHTGYATPGAANYGAAAMAIEEGISALKSAAGTMRAPAGSTVLPGSANVAGQGSMLLPPADFLIPATAQTIAASAPQISAAPADTAVPRQSEWEPSSSPKWSEPAQQRAPEAEATEAQPVATRAPEAVDGRVAEIAKAIEAKTMDVLLSPIVGLGDYAVTHFEVVVRLLGSDGAVIDRPGEVLTLAGHHLLALFDAERLSRTAAVAELLESRGKNGSVMTAATGASMSDANFLETFARVYEARNSISGQLVLTFSQADVEAFGSGTWQALSDMHSFGFRFALDHVTHLGMDFEYLAQCGFTFVKLPAQVFLKGLPSDSGFITVNDICRHLARCGLTLVVESVDDEALLAKVFGFGALFGQGQLFGAPRQISLDTLAPAQSAAA
jgi:cyclic-di-GMP phosphodiesterase, flagellum assembly factor TipF